MIGYAEIYFKIVGENGVYYAGFKGEFSKPLTRRVLSRTKKSFRKFYERFGKVYSVEYCTKEEFENSEGQEIRSNWGKC